MKMTIIAFMFVLILLGGMPSSADDAMSKLISESGAEASLVALNVATVENDATTTMSNSAAMMLVATGLIGLVGVTRRKDT
ncbi:hypothetical protein [Desulfosarcina sp.]|uniref:hypothetical protein n=1 Tax=Desulfosarcina sp. TaxID=2027861 RepID=UPI0029B69B90|nr:hypothetical protein [Desulfosarcina sp.]MDX2454637.1 hypothetical protein [Desulfosarcina sp.]MDX2492261.1 hypothetical protein [Desulfosarcina sp.]